jgi:hypothetical protein
MTILREICPTSALANPIARSTTRFREILERGSAFSTFPTRSKCATIPRFTIARAARTEYVDQQHRDAILEKTKLEMNA